MMDFKLKYRENNYLINRRSFMSIGSLIAVDLVFPDIPYGIDKDRDIGETKIYSTPHFYYKVPDNSVYVDSQNENIIFAFSDTEIMVSEDNGATWKYRRNFDDAHKITFSHIFNSGDILFATQNKLYRSDSRLRFLEEIIVQDQNGDQYIPHEPENRDYPGWYFFTIVGVNSWMINGKEVLVWGNYGNVNGGATPLNIYYSVDEGRTVKISYAFGQNPNFKDNGTQGGGKEGRILGDPDNSIICRHIHSISYNPIEGAFYATTGDGDRTEGKECHWLRGKYNFKNDQWDWEVLITASLNSRYKSGGLNFVDGDVYWISDANGPEPHDRGIFTCKPEDIGRSEAHKQLFNPEYETTRMIIEDGFILAGLPAVASPYTLGLVVSPDLGENWFVYDIDEFGPFYPSRLQKKNAEGWFRMDLRHGWIQRSEFMFIKPKTE